jgi:hypothetical protein
MIAFKMMLVLGFGIAGGLLLAAGALHWGGICFFFVFLGCADIFRS